MKTCAVALLVLVSALCNAQNKYRALIIGVSNYSQLPKESQLQFADDDAVEFYNFIMSKAAGTFDSSSVRLLLNEKATAGQIYSALDWLIDVTKENDKVIIYFSGHGDIEKKTVRQRGFLLAHDSPRSGYQVGGTVKISDLQDYMETLVTQNKARVTLVTDACRSGKLAGGGEGATQTTAALQEQWASVIKILSSQSGELSGESVEWGAGHGVFTFNLIKALSGMADVDKDGYVSLLELNMYLSTEVPKATGDAQHPVVSGNLSTKISKSDQALMAAIVAKEGPGKADQTQLLASNKGSLDASDSLSKKLHRQFFAAIDSNSLIQPAKDNAFAYYKQLASLNGSNAPFTNELRRILVGHLEDDAQKVLNRYVLQDPKLSEEDYSKARQELDSALSIISKSHRRYESITSKFLFLGADILGCTCGNDDVTEQQAAVSLATLKKAIALDPEAAYIYNSMGSAYFYLKKYDSALIYYQKAAELAPNWVYPINNLGTLSWALGNHDDAFAQYEKAISMAPYDVWGLVHAANGYQSDQMYPEALGYYKRLDSLRPGSMIDDVIGVYLSMSEYDSAMAYLNTAKQRDPNAPEVYLAYAQYYLDRKDKKAAVQSYNKAISVDPESTDALDAFGDWYYNQDKYKEAKIYFEKVIKLDASDEAVLYKLGYTYLKLKEYDASIRTFRKFIELDSTEIGAFLYLGQGNLAMGKYDAAVSAFSKVTLSYRYHNYRDSLEGGKGTEYVQNPYDVKWNSFIRSFVGLGEAYAKKGNVAMSEFNKACSEAVKVFEYPDMYDVTEKTIGSLQRAYKAGYSDWTYGNLDFRLDTLLDKFFASAINRVGRESLKSKDYGSAIKHFSKGIELDSLAPDSHYRLGLAYLGKGESDGAIKSLSTVIRSYLDPRTDRLSFSLAKDDIYSSAFISLGDAYLKKGDSENGAFNKACGCAMKCGYKDGQSDCATYRGWLEQAFKAGFNDWELVKYHHSFDFVRDSPDFKALVNRYFDEMGKRR